MRSIRIHYVQRREWTCFCLRALLWLRHFHVVVADVIVCTANEHALHA